MPPVEPPVEKPTSTDTASPQGPSQAQTKPPLKERLKVLMTTEAVFSGSLAVPVEKTISAFATEERCGPNRAYIVR